MEQTPLHRALVEALPGLEREAWERGGLPRYVLGELEGYLRCGVLAFGFSRVRCTGCGDELLVAFSCKSRGLCPSCCGRRAEDTGAHLESAVLPRVPYRQWTLSFPIRLRWALARDARLCTAVLGLFLRTLSRLTRRSARMLGSSARGTGAVTFIQRFGSALQLNVHFHVLVPDGLFDASGGFHPLPPPGDDEVHATLLGFLRKLGPLLLRHRLDELEALPEDALDGLRLSAAQARLPLGVAPVRAKRRCAQLEGFSLHANTHVHENDRKGLEQLCRYGARGPVALERLSEREDGRLAYRLKRPAPDGSTHLVLTKLELVRRLAALVPPPRFHLTRFHGVFAPNARLRARVVARAEAKEEPTPALAPKNAKTKTRIPWAELLKRTFGVDVLKCDACGAPRRVMAFVTRVSEARRFLRHLGGLPDPPLDKAPPLATGQPQLTFVPELASP